MRNNTRRAIGVLSATLLPLTGMVMLAGPAAAQTLACGSVVTASTTLDSNIGPCTGDGLVIQGSGITLDLGGHTVTGSNTTNSTGQEQVGIHLIDATGVTVRNGTVQNFDAGVAIEGGSGNTISSVNAHDNIQHDVLTGAQDECNFGDGITVVDSSGNRIQGNRAVHNGPFSGISLVGNSDNNVVSGNQAAQNNVANIFAGTGETAPCGAPFSRPHQDIGIRIEGPGADNNTVSGNSVTDNELNGISINGYVCHPPGGAPPQANNGGNTISGNSVARNGFAGPGETQDGIAILQQGPLGRVTCPASGNTIVGNSSTANARDGIFVSSLSHNNTINQNVVRNNAQDGIRLNGPFTSGGVNFPGAYNNTLIGNQGTGNAEHDGHDANPNCDNNHWQRNLFGTVNQACVAANGGTGTVRP